MIFAQSIPDPFGLPNPILQNPLILLLIYMTALTMAFILFYLAFKWYD